MYGTDESLNLLRICYIQGTRIERLNLFLLFPPSSFIFEREREREREELARSQNPLFFLQAKRHSLS